MRFLTDCPADLGDFISAARWRPESAASLPADDGAIWRVLGGGPEPRVADIHDGDGPGFWTLATVVADAPRSQYDALHEALGRGLRPAGPTACLALRGRGFHGQRDRAWKAEAGNLFLSVALAPGLPVDRLVPGLTMLPVVAVVDAIRASGGPSVAPGIKWVNDVLVEGRKVAGVLTATHVRGALVDAAVLGIGVNVVRAPRLEPTPFVPAAGCLREAGITVGLGAFFWRVLDGLARRYRELLEHGHEPLLASYRDRSVIVGRPVRIYEDAATSGADPIVGVVQSIEPDLSLRLQGRADPVRRGRLVLDAATSEARWCVAAVNPDLRVTRVVEEP
jgi:biotin-[acetyl-CoA-carboxylase] ligase BirA-like protein